jgi:hypothetical protein
VTLLRSTVLAALALACTDYDFSEIPDPPDRDDDPIEDRRCEMVDRNFEDVGDPVTCVDIVLPPLAAPVVKWRNRVGVRALVAGPVLDTNADGKVDETDPPIVVALERGTGPGHALVFSPTGQLLARSPVPLTQPILADLIAPDGAEVWFGSADGSVWRFDRDGFTKHGDASTTQFLAVVDIAGDGHGELVGANGTWYEPATGRIRDFPGDAHPFAAPQVQLFDGAQQLVTSHGVWLADGSRSCTTSTPNTAVIVADLDHDGKDDLLALGPVGSAPRPIGLVEQRGCLTRRVLHSWSNDDVGVFPLGVALADFRGEGRSEIAVSVWQEQGNAYGTSMHWLEGPNRWTTWHTSSQARQYVRSPIGIDLDGDGASEVVSSGPTILDGRTGRILYDLPVNGTISHSENPIIALDIDLDGKAEILVATDSELVVFTGADHGWAPAPSIWNQPAFNGTNVLPNGKVPRVYGTAAASGNRYRAVPPTLRSRNRGSDLVVRILSLCEYECETGWAYATVQVGNEGTRAIDGPVRMRLYGYRGAQPELIADAFYRNVPAARWLPSHSYAFEVDRPYDDVWAVVSPDGWELDQCSERNDATAWATQVCW